MTENPDIIQETGEPEYIDVKEASRIVGLSSPSTIAAACKKGTFKTARRFGNSWAVERWEVYQYKNTISRKRFQGVPKSERPPYVPSGKPRPPKTEELKRAVEEEDYVLSAEIAVILGMKTAANATRVLQAGRIPSAKRIDGRWVAKRSDVIAYRDKKSWVPGYITLPEASRQLGISLYMLKKMYHAGQIPCDVIEESGWLLFKEADVQKLIAIRNYPKS